jgi:hypothetical protein
MLRTIQMSEQIYVQGEFKYELPNGQICVRVGSKEFIGTPVKATQAA